MKAYHKIPIQECGEPLIPIPLEQFAVETPHPYAKLGANYGEGSPYFLRQDVVARLLNAQAQLQQQHPGWQIKIFDAYRPIAVQQFMVDYTFKSLLEKQGLTAENLTSAQVEELWQQVYQIWALPSLNPATPPPHSTGAAVDITLSDENGKTFDLGSEIDELSRRSHPDYYANPISAAEQTYHARRQLLHTVMSTAGFRRHPGEWWHFSFGDQMWAWQRRQEPPTQAVVARYGRVEKI